MDINHKFHLGSKKVVGCKVIDDNEVTELYARFAARGIDLPFVGTAGLNILFDYLELADELGVPEKAIWYKAFRSYHEEEAMHPTRGMEFAQEGSRRGKKLAVVLREDEILFCERIADEIAAFETKYLIATLARGGQCGSSYGMAFDEIEEFVKGLGTPFTPPARGATRAEYEAYNEKNLRWRKMMRQGLIHAEVRLAQHHREFDELYGSTIQSLRCAGFSEDKLQEIIAALL